MVKSKQIEPKHDRLRCMANDIDAKLIKQLVRKKDHKAFSEIFARHKNSAFALAYHICRHHEIATESVQEAMLTVWLKAESFQSEFSLRKWILGIVARKSLKAIHKHTKEKRNMAKAHWRMSNRTEPIPLETKFERDEMRKKIQHILPTIPLKERQILDLYYRDEMTQEEIGTTLAMPQRTVSFKLKTTLKRLRLALSQNAISAAS